MNISKSAFLLTTSLLALSMTSSLSAMEEEMNTPPHTLTPSVKIIEKHLPIKTLSIPVVKTFYDVYKDVLKIEKTESEYVFKITDINNKPKEILQDLNYYISNPNLPIENICCNISNYIPKNESQQELHDWASKFADYSGPKTCGLFIEGQVGTGKTHMSVAISKICQQNKEKTLFLQPHEILEKSFKNNRFWQEYSVFILDDFNGEKTSIEAGLIKDLLMHAFNQGGKKIFITSNDSYENFIKRSAPANEVDRFTDRVKNMFKVIKVNGESNRSKTSWFE